MAPTDASGKLIMGFDQQDAGALSTDAKTPVETLDYGEIWAMREFVSYYLPRLDRMGSDRFGIGVNGWWARMWTPDLRVIPKLEKLGIHSISFGPMYFGHDNHPNTEARYIREMRTRPFGFPVFKDRGPKVNPTTGWHAKVMRGDSRASVIGYTDTFEPAPGYELFIRKAAEKGVTVPRSVRRASDTWSVPTGMPATRTTTCAPSTAAGAVRG